MGSYARHIGSKRLNLQDKPTIVIRAGAALPLAATIINPCQSRIHAHSPRKHAFFIDLQGDGLAIEFELNGCHDINFLLSIQRKRKLRMK